MALPVKPKPKLHKETRPLWRAAGYPKGMGSAGVVPPPSPSFKRLYHLSSTEHAISDIVFSRLKIATIDQLNDPFELLAARFLHNRALKIEVSTYKKQIGKEYGLVCFAADWADPVLWTHYAHQHTGMCLGFDVPAALAIEVEYQEDRIEVDGDVLTSRLREQLLRTKYTSWKYENEWRIQAKLTDALKEGDLYFEKIGKRIHLAEVILGARCTAPVGEVRKLVAKHYKDVVTFQARPANGSFLIVPRETTVPQETPPLTHVR